MSYFPCELGGVFETPRDEMDVRPDPDFAAVAPGRHIRY